MKGPTRLRLPRPTSLEVAHFTKSIIPVCADSVAQLRACDVFRAMHLAYDAGMQRPFGHWLRAERPDLTGKIEEAIAFCEEDIADAREAEKARKRAMA